MKNKKSSKDFNVGKIVLIVIFLNAGIGMMLEEPFLGLCITAAVLFIGLRNPVKKYFRKQKMKEKFAVYERMIGTYKETPLDYMAESLGTTQDRVVDDLNKLTDEGWFSKAFIDYDKNVFVVSRNTRVRRSGYDETGFIDSIPCPFCRRMIPRTVKFCFYCGKSLEIISGIELRRLESNQLIREAMAVCYDDKIRNNLACIGSFTDDILKRFEEEPELIDDQYKFLDVYLPKTINEIRNYKELCRMPELDSEEAAVKKQIEDSLDTIENAFSRILKKISIDGVFDLSADVSTLNTVLAQEGLTDPDFEISKE